MHCVAVQFDVLVSGSELWRQWIWAICEDSVYHLHFAWSVVNKGIWIHCYLMYGGILI